MNEQFDTTAGQPNDGLTTEDIVSAGRRKDVQPVTGKAAISQPAGEQEPKAAQMYDATTAARDPQRGAQQEDGAEYAPDAGAAGPQPGAPPAHASRTAGQPGQAAVVAPLLAEESASAFQTRWETIQTAFVDEPRRAVEQADGLVAEVMQQLADTFARERDGLERQWSLGSDVSTEDLRLALQRYRSFFQRLLSA